MRSIDDIRSQNPQHGFQFPGVFEITVVGKAGTGFEARVPEILADLGVSLLGGSLSHRSSRGGHYVAFSLSFTCPTREKYDAVHTALRADADVRWTI